MKLNETFRICAFCGQVCHLYLLTYSTYLMLIASIRVTPRTSKNRVTPHTAKIIYIKKIEIINIAHESTNNRLHIPAKYDI